MAKRSTEAYISQMEKTAAYWKKKADREYAYAKNSKGGYHYEYAKKAYSKAEEFSEKAENARRYGY
jgi:hypothetical protein